MFEQDAKATECRAEEGFRETTERFEDESGVETVERRQGVGDLRPRATKDNAADYRLLADQILAHPDKVNWWLGGARSFDRLTNPPSRPRP